MERPLRAGMACLLIASGVWACASPGAEGPAPTGAAEGTGLTVLATGLGETARGEVLFALFDSAESFARDAPQARGRGAVEGGAARWRVDDLPPGLYAVKAFHDADGDGVLDLHPLGFPTEPYGFSADARGRFGPPEFAAAAFAWEGGAGRVVVRLR